MKITTLESRVKKLNEIHKNNRIFIACLHNTGKLTLNDNDNEPEKEITLEQYIEFAENNQTILIVSVAGMSREQAQNMPNSKETTLEHLIELSEYIKACKVPSEKDITYDFTL